MLTTVLVYLVTDMFVSKTLHVSSTFGASYYSADLLNFKSTIVKMNANSINWGLVNRSGRGMALASLLSTLCIGVLLPLQRAGFPLQIASGTWGSSGAPTLTVKSNPTPLLSADQTSYYALYLFLAAMVYATVAGSTGTLHFAGRSTRISSSVTPSGTGDTSNHHSGTGSTGRRRKYLHFNPQVQLTSVLL